MKHTGTALVIVGLFVAGIGVGWLGRHQAWQAQHSVSREENDWLRKIFDHCNQLCAQYDNATQVPSTTELVSKCSAGPLSLLAWQPDVPMNAVGYIQVGTVANRRIVIVARLVDKTGYLSDRGLVSAYLPGDNIGEQCDRSIVMWISR